jgi:hypothetical protein
VQRDFNVTGHVHSGYPLQNLTYSVNGGILRPLTFKWSKRIVEYGDFNADIPMVLLKPGENTVVLTATDIKGDSVSTEVTITRFLSGSYSLPAVIPWSEVSDLEDVGKCSDGKWTISNEGLRTAQVGYDRIFLIGNKTWTDYEATASVTIHGMPERSGPQSGQVKHVGFCMRWAGHPADQSNITEQPKSGLHPRGGVVWLTILKGCLPPVRQFFPGDSEEFRTFDPFAVRLGDPFWMKASCETVEPETTRYSFKVWRMDVPEPDGWDFQVVQRSSVALRSGGLALVAHELDVTFGDIHVRELPKPVGDSREQQATLIGDAEGHYRFQTDEWKTASGSVSARPRQRPHN